MPQKPKPDRCMEDSCTEACVMDVTDKIMILHSVIPHQQAEWRI